jgi:hypothetical protein
MGRPHGELLSLVLGYAKENPFDLIAIASREALSEAQNSLVIWHYGSNIIASIEPRVVSKLHGVKMVSPNAGFPG